MVKGAIYQSGVAKVHYHSMAEGVKTCDLGVAAR
jgi:hypothetical protein